MIINSVGLAQSTCLGNEIQDYKIIRTDNNIVNLIGLFNFLIVINLDIFTDFVLIKITLHTSKNIHKLVICQNFVNKGSSRTFSLKLDAEQILFRLITINSFLHR